MDKHSPHALSRNQPRAGSGDSSLEYGGAHSIFTGIYATDCVCPRPLFEEVVKDFLDDLHVTLPVVHRPTFFADFAARREESDRSFLALVIGMVAVAVATSARRFNSYRSGATPIPFQSRTAMVSHCFRKICDLTEVDEFDAKSYNNWAALLLIGSAQFQLKNLHSDELRHASKRFWELTRFHRFHDPTTYTQLDCIETQLRKKAFWQTFISYV